MTLKFKNKFLIRINSMNTDLLLDIKNKSILLNEDCSCFIKNIK